MRHSSFVAALALALVAGSCERPMDPGTRSSLAASIVDGAHAGNVHFYWLPPLVKAPSPTGVFDASLAPIVRIDVCEVAEGACNIPLAQFNMTTGPGSENVRVSAFDENYSVNWHTDQFALSDANDYRIRVLVDGIELGHADVDVVNGGAALKNVNTQEFIALLDGRTLPIKFRIEQGAIFGGASIQPAAGPRGTAFTITDPQGLIQPGSLALFYKLGQDPATGANADNIQISADSKTLTGLVPQGALGGANFVSVRASLFSIPYFADLTFEVQ